MEISGVSSYSSCFYFANPSGLSEETKRKLIELGIDPNTVTSETQAKALIDAILKKLEAQVSSNAQACSSELELFTRAKNLARKVGVSISASRPLGENLKILGQAIKEKKEYSSEFEALKSEFEKNENTHSTIFAAMNLTANMNKYIHQLK